MRRNSSIFSFRGLCIGTGILILLLFEVWARHTYYFENNKYTLQYDPQYQFVEKLNKEKPDLILVGNSLVGNFDVFTLSEELSHTLKRPVKIFPVIVPGSFSGWWYLILKNQIKASQLSGVPVGVVYRTDNLTQPELIAGPYHYIKNIQNHLTNDEPVFHKKTGYVLSPSKHFSSKAYFYRDRISKDLMNYLLESPLFYYQLWRGKESWVQITSNRNALGHLNERFSFKNFKAESDPFTYSVKKSVPHAYVLEGVRNSFLPDMIEEMKNFQLFFIELHQHPPVAEPLTLVEYRNQLNSYLEQLGIKNISLVHESVLDDPELYWADDHMKPEGSCLNAQVFATRLINEKILK